MRGFSTALVLALLAGALPAAAEARVRVVWPQETAVQAGERVTVVVRASRTVRVALLRLSSDGRPVRTVVARRMRSGRFVVAVPAGRHLLAVDAGQRRRSRVIQGVAAPPPPPPPPTCRESGRPAATMELDRTRAAREETFSITLRNVGEVCLFFGAHYHYERWNGVAWERVQADYPSPDWGAGIAPGETYTHTGWVFPELEPGRHRVVKTLDPGVVVTAEIEIT